MVDESGEKPDWPEEFEAYVAHLGPPQSVHSFTGPALRRKLLFGGAGIAASALLLFGYFSLIGARIFEYKLIALMSAPAVLGIGLIVQSIRHRGLWVLRFPTGVLCWKRGTIVSFPWEEIGSVSFGRFDGTATAMPFGPDMDGGEETWRALIPLGAMFGRFRIASLQIARNDGEEIALPSSLNDFAELGEAIQVEVFGRLWPAIWQEFREGNPVAFGDVRVGLGGLSVAADSLSWIEFDSANVAQHQIILRRVGRTRPWKALPLRGVPNPHVFLWLLAKGQLPAIEEPAVET